MVAVRERARERESERARWTAEDVGGQMRRVGRVDAGLLAELLQLVCWARVGR